MTHVDLETEVPHALGAPVRHRSSYCTHDAHTVLNLHWCGTPVPSRETNLAFQFQAHAKAVTQVFRLEKQTWHSISKLTRKLALQFKNDVAS